MTSDIQRTIQGLEREYAEQKETFEQWKEENASEADTQPYLDYVEQFCSWEKGVLDQLKELRNSIAKQPVAPEPELPTVDLDTQLNMLLERVDAPQFILAFMTMAQKDPSFLKKAFEVVMDECRSTGFSNPILPQQTLHASRSTPSFDTHFTPQQQRPGPSANLSHQHHLHHHDRSGTPTNSGGLYIPPASHHHQPQQYVQSSSLLVSSSRYHPSNPSHTFGTIPEGWTVDAPIRKQPRQSSPTRQYRTPVNLPFKDFSQS